MTHELADDPRVQTVSRRTTASVAQVWSVIADGWAYPVWVVGAARMRAVEAAWPAAGSTLHHSVGTWPAMLNDETEVLEVEPGRRILLQAKGWPAGAATVEIVLTATDQGALIEMREDATRGPGALVPVLARQAGIVPRNKETLHRLALIAERATEPVS